MADDIDEADREEMRRALAGGDESDLVERMSGPLVFGTAGLRGILGAGSNRMNCAVTVRAAAGIGQYLLDSVSDARGRGVVIGYDSRHRSREFAHQAASVFAALGVVAHLFPTMCPTPVVAFALVELHAAAAIMVTASHNPAQYSGIKVYWGNGAQIIPPQDRGIAAAIDGVGPARDVPRLPIEQARAAGLVREVPGSVVDRYLQRLASLSVHTDGREGMRIVYTPMHGVGNAITHAALFQAGFGDVVSVAEQAQPDPGFPTLPFPNPEEPGALDLAIELARERGADLVLAHDPDADRLAVAVPSRDGKGFVQLSGNQVGILIAYTLLVEHPTPASHPLVISTIVSSPLVPVMARACGARCEEVLTGFKWIVNRALEIEQSTEAQFIFGFEEALGYTIGGLVRDKDGISAAVIFSEIAAHCRGVGRSVMDQLERIYRQFALYVSGQKNIVCAGHEGMARMQAAMDRLRHAPPTFLGDRRVVAVRDYLHQQTTTSAGEVTPIALPASNVLIFDLEDGSRVAVRPSGTEPKLKLYIDVREEILPDEPIERAEARADRKRERIERAVVAVAS